MEKSPTILINWVLKFQQRHKIYSKKCWLMSPVSDLLLKRLLPIHVFRKCCHLVPWCRDLSLMHRNWSLWKKSIVWNSSNKLRTILFLKHLWTKRKQKIFLLWKKLMRVEPVINLFLFYNEFWKTKVLFDTS